MTEPPTARLLQTMIAAALKAEPLLLAAFDAAKENDVVETKPDGTVVTATDMAAETVIRGVLGGAFPDIPIIGEETSDTHAIPDEAKARYFLIDPLDGTSEFRRRNDDFTVNVALVEAGRATIGVVLAPRHGQLFTGSSSGAFKAVRDGEGLYGVATPISVRAAPSRLVVITSSSRRPLELVEFLDNLHRPFDEIHVGSLLKICRIAEGMADVYPCPMPTSAWDTAASQVVLEAAGGQVLTWGPSEPSKPLRYDVTRFRRDGSFLNPFFIANGHSI